MNHLTFVWNKSQDQGPPESHWQEFSVWAGLFLAAFPLFSFNLGFPFLDGQESLVAQMAKEMAHNNFLSGRWLFPTLWGESYHRHPPLGIFFVALTYLWGGVGEETTRLSSGILTAFSIPLLYGLGREAFGKRMPALFSALIFLTLFPVVRQGRSAWLDGTVICFEILTMWCVLRLRRDLRWSIGVGLSLSCLFLTQGVMSLCTSVAILLFLGWDTPRVLNSDYFWLGIILGLIPAIAWYCCQWISFGSTAIEGIFLVPFQEQKRLFRGLWGLCGLQFVTFSLPWLIFAYSGLKLIRESLIWGWAKLILVWGGSYLIIFTVLPLPGISYLIPLYPPLALAGGLVLAEVFDGTSKLPYPKFWRIALFVLSGLVSLSCFSFWLNFPVNFDDLSYRLSLILILIAAASTFVTTAIFITCRNRQFVTILFFGMYMSLMLLVNSPYWNGEIQSQQSIQLLAQMLKDRVPSHEVIYADLAQENQTLNFYSDHHVIPTTAETLSRYWHTLPDSYFLITLETWQKLPLEQVDLLDEVFPNWYLVTRTKN
ncbi:MAG: ArnT family glycosyltransferase [cyanobacterium endosymbiont of Rhopalodia musculus]|uniref:ArnT family glycosyltransferase n=1 Tax=cyanobacterium endosymbiont of Epithemia clementina EcSB TaxID=3034674 RepID=UPI00247FBFD1|nr:glycosyltransferase family 39 protein [cyanobacterium endosymbiont of Epithemia clementina EcSB]WGT67236.1 glycosyltransferase family 39 protein [cyanobacterium endosymbiont of Epithemia clementina EcSB]